MQGRYFSAGLPCWISWRGSSAVYIQYICVFQGLGHISPKSHLSLSKRVLLLVLLSFLLLVFKVASSILYNIHILYQIPHCFHSKLCLFKYLDVSWYEMLGRGRLQIFLVFVHGNHSYLPGLKLWWFIDAKIRYRISFQPHLLEQVSSKTPATAWLHLDCSPHIIFNLQSLVLYFLMARCVSIKPFLIYYDALRTVWTF